MKEEDQGSINGVDPTIEFGGVVGPFITKTEVDQRGKRCEIEFRIMRSEVERMMIDGKGLRFRCLMGSSYTSRQQPRPIRCQTYHGLIVPD
jgi:hypothetical protein